MNIIMLGAPGAGKGTIASQMSERYGFLHVSTGDIFRENIKNGTELGKLAKSYIDSGTLVPDDVTIKIVIDKLKSDECKNGFILDGFPRTINQADGLKNALIELNSKIDFVLLVEASDDLIAKRLSGRRVCEKCGETYHIEHFPPKADGICDKCGGKLIIRKDDSAEVVSDRLKTYHKQTSPLIEYYNKQGLIKTIDGTSSDFEARLKQIDQWVKK